MADDAPLTLEADRALLDAYRRGEREAFARIFEMYLDDVARTLRAGVVVRVDGDPIRLGKSLAEQDLEGLIQDTFLKAFSETARRSYDGVRPFGAYLSTIARNLLIDRGRAAQKSARFEVDDLDLERFAGEGAGGIEHHQEAGELAAALESFCEELGEEEKKIFELRYYQEQSHRHCAAALGLSAIQVRRRDSRIRSRLLRFLRERGYLENARVTIGTSLLGRKEEQDP